MIIYFIIVSSTCLSAKKAALKAAFFAQERRDENPGRVRYRAALCEAETPCLSANSLIIKHLQNLHPILHPETAVILGVLLASNDTMF